MSANRYSICPRCYREAKNAHAAKVVLAEKAYGKATSVAYRKLCDEAQILNPVTLVENVREDWEFTLDKDGTFTAGYWATCETCGWTFKHTHKEQVKL